MQPKVLSNEWSKSLSLIFDDIFLYLCTNKCKYLGPIENISINRASSQAFLHGGQICLNWVITLSSLHLGDWTRFGQSRNLKSQIKQTKLVTNNTHHLLRAMLKLWLMLGVTWSLKPDILTWEGVLHDLNNLNVRNPGNLLRWISNLITFFLPPPSLDRTNFWPTDPLVAWKKENNEYSPI